MGPQTYTKAEAEKAIWKDLMKARRGAKRREFWLGDQSLEYIKDQIALHLDKNHHNLDCYHMSTGIINTMHILTNPSGCVNDAYFETHPCICWHRRGPDCFVRSEHIPYAVDSECRAGGGTHRVTVPHSP